MRKAGLSKGIYVAFAVGLFVIIIGFHPSGGNPPSPTTTTSITQTTQTTTSTMSSNTTSLQTPLMSLMIPLYIDPNNPAWQTVENTHLQYANVAMVVIINPSSGPGGSQQASYVNGVQTMKNEGIIVIGYLPTGYGQTPISAAEAMIQEYSQWYAVNGIFFDQMASNPGMESYYSTLAQFAHGLGMSITVGNAGYVSLSPSYIGIHNFDNIYESGSYPAISTIQSAFQGYPRQDFSAIVYGVSLNTNWLNQISPYVGYVYVTDANLPNPYGALPSYFSQLVQYLSQN